MKQIAAFSGLYVTVHSVNCNVCIKLWELFAVKPFHRHYFSSNASTSSNQMRPQASDGILRSPLGDTAIVPTFGPSGRQERLNCCEKNLR